MGVKEYRFLTRTMKTIGTRSNKLAEAEKGLILVEDDLVTYRFDADSLRAKEKKDILHLKNGEEIVKEKIANLEAKRKLIATHHGEQWGSAESLKKEIKAINEELGATTFFFRLSKSGSIEIKRLRQRMQALKNRERLVKKDDKDRSNIDREIAKLDKRLSKIDIELKPLKQKWDANRSRLETEIEELVKLRGSTKKEIKLLEEEIPQLWDSIAHLIPFSTALENA